MRSFVRPLLLLLLAGSWVHAATPAPRDHAGYRDAGAHVFLTDEVTQVRVTMDPSDLETLLAEPWRDDYRPCTIAFRNAALDTVLHDVGIRVRGNLSRGAHKKSWKLSFDAFVDGRRLHGLETLNLNGEHSDPTISRSHMSWDLMRAMHVPAARTAHVRLVINDGSRVDGIYLNVEQVDARFVDAWFGNRDGRLFKCLFARDRADLRHVPPGDAEAYRLRGEGRTYVEKLRDDPDHGGLAAFIDFVEHSTDAEFAAGIARRLNVDDFLRAMAVDVVIANWDNYWYGANNYYLYENPATGRFEYVPHDLDNTLGVDFFGIDWAKRPYDGWGDHGYGSRRDGLPPLIRRLLAEPRFERQLRRYVLEVVDRHCDPEAWRATLDAVRARLLPWAFRGSFAHGRMDNHFTADMFAQSFDLPPGYRNNDSGCDYGLKHYLPDRAAYLRATVERPAAPSPLTIGGFDAVEDWVEITNTGNVAVALGGHHLTDDLRDPFKWTFPDVVLPAGESLRIWCDAGDGSLHAGFKLDKDGEMIGLTGPIAAGAPLIDHLVYGPREPKGVGGDLSAE